MARETISNERSKMNFIRELVKRHIKLRHLKPREVYIFNVIAEHGSYQIVVGPEYTMEQARKLKLKPHSRRLEINGLVHNLFVNPKHISPTPLQEDVRYNLKGSVIMKQMIVHIVDKDGEGKSVRIESIHETGFRAGQKINLAGKMGEEMLQRYMTTGHLLKETYKIIQKDILEALK